jgi:hypothetical protein
MKLITNKYERIAKIECSCCRESHSVTITVDDNELWFSFKDAPYSFKNAMSYCRNFLKNPESYVSGDGRFKNAILCTKNMLKELRDELAKHFKPISIKNYETPIVTSYYNYHLMSWYERASLKERFRTLIYGKTNSWDVRVIYDLGEIVVYQEETDFQDYAFGYKLRDASIMVDKRFWLGNWEANLEDDEPGKLLWALNKELK